MDMDKRPRIVVGLVDPFKLNELVDQDNYTNHVSIERDVCDPANSYSGIGESIIPVDFSGLSDTRFMQATEETIVPSHTHEGPVVRIITWGEAVVNGKLYKEGDWMVIPDGFEYKVESAGGYKALWVCGKC